MLDAYVVRKKTFLQLRVEFTAPMRDTKQKLLRQREEQEERKGEVQSVITAGRQAGRHSCSVALIRKNFVL